MKSSSLPLHEHGFERLHIRPQVKQQDYHKRLALRTVSSPGAEGLTLATSVLKSVQQASLESMHLLELELELALELELVWVTAQHAGGVCVGRHSMLVG